MYKIVTKILAKRIKRVLPRIIDDNQSTFLGVINLLHNVVVVNYVVHESKSMKSQL